MHATPSIVRTLDDAAVIFDARTWLTHVLPPATAAIVEAIRECPGAHPASVSHAKRLLREDFDLDPESPDTRELLRMLSEIGILER